MDVPYRGGGGLFSLCIIVGNVSFGCAVLLIRPKLCQKCSTGALCGVSLSQQYDDGYRPR